ncbi:MAG: elongation factor G, partial [Oscillospiraceae bacterium]|nr:elongation factor G [Oscillospiraceae bacterium]
ATTCLGTLTLLDNVLGLAPAPATSETGAFVWKTVSDQYGKYSYIKVLGGQITADTTLVNARTGETEKLGRLYTMCGKKATEVKALSAGDIGAIGKMDKVKTGDTLCDPKNVEAQEPIAYAPACYSQAIAPKTKGQEEKVAAGLARLNEEDPSFSLVNNAETHQLVISGTGDQQLDVLVAKLKSRFGVDAELSPAKVAFREKIKKTVQAHGRHKKQTGGSGQFGDVWVRFEPQEEQDELIFDVEVVGGAVPKNFNPAVEKGIQEAVLKGPLAGYPMVGLKAVLYDGSYHPVDSNEMAFKLAAILAFKEAMPNAMPTLLEPVGALAVTVPEAYVGDVMGDLSKRRGRPMGMNPDSDGNTVVEAEVPMAEMGSYAIDLRAMTQARGSFTLEFVRYEEVPKANQQKIIDEAKNDE